MTESTKPRRSFKDMAGMLQTSVDKAASAEPSEHALGLAYQLGGIAWMECTDEGSLKPVVETLKGGLRAAFLIGLSEVINAPNNQESMTAENLRPYVAKQLEIA